jgi:hypothetical protein
MRSEKKATDALIAKLQQREDEEHSQHRRQLAKGFLRAMSHLTDQEMQDIEEILYRAIGRSVVDG